ncbi:unnamed protein product [Fusarium graminearum]|uniref:Uncharacterized protein n=1 Tax=Gibberella zeae TaxID=5518 RepID=A0A4E9DAC8_GIBZA|nr:unnamed protein product [Fusarium graminearum]CAF3533235.1 unnamed protein product [Fusarium graminearum]CAG1991123.1 unnamed protein product [Fusarium graminearum]CAG2006387.1 unnamed protein product [Fusarium graminearum]
MGNCLCRASDPEKNIDPNHFVGPVVDHKGEDEVPVFTVAPVDEMVEPATVTVQDDEITPVGRVENISAVPIKAHAMVRGCGLTVICEDDTQMEKME